MKTSGKLIPIFSCLFFICSVAHSGASKEEKYYLLGHFNNASLVEESLQLVSSSSELAASTVVSYGFWYGICQSAGLVSTLTSRPDPPGTEESELQEFKAFFCNQLAAVITSTEVALAGHAWPCPFVQPLRFVGTVFIAYKTYTHYDPYFTPVLTMAYFTHEIIARTVAGAYTIKALRNHGRIIQPKDYANSEYIMLKSIAGMMVGATVYNTSALRGVTIVEAVFAYHVSATVAGTLIALFIQPASNSSADHAFGADSLVGAGVLAGSIAGAGVLAGSIAGATAGAIAVGTPLNNLFMPMAALGTLVASINEFEFSSEINHKINAGAIAGLAAGVGVMKLLALQSSILDSDHLLRNIPINLAIAWTITEINGVANNAVYGFSLAESFTKTARNQWKKFYAPLDYLHSLFN
ncbi:hypothetical protein [Endozoicomonas sp. ISHI1]|uniref:hypothetical protein n=1 Tax=Endozoicomonas sp. ISHI1 TaxID=2825882 RepID=UPI00214771CE|nr:hypothetical protein [Endozoicomonas sp. ISHI1]